jgi:hypothetical protein
MERRMDAVYAANGAVRLGKRLEVEQGAFDHGRSDFQGGCANSLRGVVKHAHSDKADGIARLLHRFRNQPESLLVLRCLRIELQFQILGDAYL